MIKPFSEIKKTEHIREIRPLENDIVLPVQNIFEKYIYINVNNKHFVTIPPNKFEKD